MIVLSELLIAVLEHIDFFEFLIFQHELMPLHEYLTYYVVNAFRYLL